MTICIANCKFKFCKSYIKDKTAARITNGNKHYNFKDCNLKKKKEKICVFSTNYREGSKTIV